VIPVFLPMRPNLCPCRLARQLGLGPREGFDDVVQQALCVCDRGFDLIFGDVDDVAVVKTIAESVDVS
jgi:hypothetical protein